VSSEDKNKALARRFLEAFANGDLDTLDELLAPDFVDHSLLPGQVPGREGYIQSAAEQHAAFSDIRYTVEYQATDGDMVISRLTMRGIHDRDTVFGVAPTGRDLVIPIIVIDRVSEGKIVEEWSADTITPFLEALAQQMRERERVEQELRVARSIQQASLPKEVPTLEGWEISPLYRPAREVGGDFYDFHLLSDGRVGVVVGDATGKGVPAALVVTATYSMLRAVTQALGSFSPGEVLAQVNETLLARIPPNTFVTCFYSILDPKSGLLSYANAGHDLPYLRHGDGDCEELRARGMPLGLMSRMSYEEGEASLREEDGVLFYSDGLVEAHAPKGEMFGFPRLRGLVAEHGDGERSLVDSLLEELYSFVGEGWEQEDDITLLTLQRSAARR
jgi:serine phosphatase RsbU (regulator of sigma subunit)/predicted ester cyclase